MLIRINCSHQYPHKTIYFCHKALYNKKIHFYPCKIILTFFCSTKNLLWIGRIFVRLTRHWRDFVNRILGLGRRSRNNKSSQGSCFIAKQRSDIKENLSASQAC